MENKKLIRITTVPVQKLESQLVLTQGKNRANVIYVSKRGKLSAVKIINNPG